LAERCGEKKRKREEKGEYKKIRSKTVPVEARGAEEVK